MPVKALNPYLNFNGTASQAIALYERALGAKVAELSRFSDTPGTSFSGDDANRVMHARLEVAGSTLMISDAMPGSDVTPGTNVFVCLQYGDTSDVDTHFAALAEGGTVLMPLDDTFWGARFGMLQDAYGIKWMLNAELPK